MDKHSAGYTILFLLEVDYKGRREVNATGSFHPPLVLGAPNEFLERSAYPDSLALGHPQLILVNLNVPPPSFFLLVWFSLVYKVYSWIKALSPKIEH